MSYLIAGVCISGIGIAGGATGLLMPLVFTAGFFVIGAQTALNAVTSAVYPSQIRSTGLGSAVSGAAVDPADGRPQP